MSNIKAPFLSLQCLLFRCVASQHGWIPRLKKQLPVIKTSCADGHGGLAELYGPIAEGFTVVSSNDGSGGFASALTRGSSRVSIDGGEGGLAGSGARTGGSSAGLVTLAFLDLAWPLSERL